MANTKSAKKAAQALGYSAAGFDNIGVTSDLSAT